LEAQLFALSGKYQDERGSGYARPKQNTAQKQINRQRRARFLNALISREEMIGDQCGLLARTSNCDRRPNAHFGAKNTTNITTSLASSIFGWGQ
jgi:hypothetical protein